ncbi:MAG TPA: deoxyribodipyrimidine photo-lyase [Pseudonocardia sp.]|jgi:deoxyribodipyrimidine photo-lyase|nr:deoxyribodipyrimidine photo-lyase [Pseudonocardia sp.]
MEERALLWFRRDLRLADQPALLAAADAAPAVLALFVLDDHLLRSSGNSRIAFLVGCLRALDSQLEGRLLIRAGDPVDIVADTARHIGARTVHVSADTGPYGRERDERVAASLASDGITLVRTGSPYAITPGRVRKADGEPYRVFTPFHRAWLEHGWRAPAESGADSTDWLTPPAALREELPPVPEEIPALPEPGEAAGLVRWREFAENSLDGYRCDRDRPDRDGTSGLSPYLKFGCLHPRTLLAELPSGTAAETFRSELAWREFYADVLLHRPDTARSNADRRFDAMPLDSGPAADLAFGAWCEGRTGFPIVDAGMRQLLAEGWMHNRVRMIVASFLVKDLHLPWWRGARHFMRHLTDGDLASNQHGWQWAAGSGTDAAPYFRIFNPTTQGEKFDPDGAYVHRYVPELREVGGKAVHQPWKLPGGPPNGYPQPIVDHKKERAEALERYALTRQAR